MNNETNKLPGISIKAENLRIELSEIVTLLERHEAEKAAKELKVLSNFAFQGQPLRNALQGIIDKINASEPEEAKALLLDFISTT